MLPDDASHKIPIILIESACHRLSIAQLRKLPIDRPNNLNIVMFDELQVLLLIRLRLHRQLLVNLLVEFALLVLLPVAEIEIVVVFVKKKTQYLEEQFEEDKKKHVFVVVLAEKG